MAANYFEARLAPERIVQVHRSAAGYHEDMPDGVVREGLSDVIGDADSGHEQRVNRTCG